MTFELVVWHEAGALTAERAGTVVLDDVAPHPDVVAFAGDLAAMRPEAGLTVHESRYVRVLMAPESADEISGEVYALARAHKLVCYDPVRRLVHNLGPTGAYEGMQLHTGDGVIVVDPDLPLVRDVLGRLGPGNPFAALVVFGRHFVQVSPEGAARYELEYKDSVQERLYRTHLADLDDVRTAFHEYATDDRAFLERHDWDVPGTA